MNPFSTKVHGGSYSAVYSNALRLKEVLENVNDVELYHIYRERFANPNRANFHGKSVKPGNTQTMMSIHHERNKDVGLGRYLSISRVMPVEEYFTDQFRLHQQRVLTYRADPNEFAIQPEQVEFALPFQLEDPDHPKEALEKWKAKMELSDDEMAVPEPVRKYFMQKQAQLERYYLEEPEFLDYMNPVRYYNETYDEWTQMLEDPIINTDMDDDEESQELINELYDTIKFRPSPIKQPPTHLFLNYAFQMYNWAIIEEDSDEVEKWYEVLQPFIYENKFDPIERPLTIEVPSLRLIEPSYYGDDKIPRENSWMEIEYVAYPKDKPDHIIESTYRLKQPMRILWGKTSIPKCLHMTLDKLKQGHRVEIECPPRLLYGEDGWLKAGFPANTPVIYDVKVTSVEHAFPEFSPDIDVRNDNKIPGFF